MLTAIAVLLRIISNPVGNVFQKQLTSGGHHPLLVNFLTYLLLSVLVITLAWPVHWLELPPGFWYNAIAAGIAGALGNGFLVKALQMGDLSVLGPVNSYKSVIGIIVGIFLLGEVPNIWGLLGVVLIIWGSYFVLDTTEERFSWALLKKKEIQYRIWAMVLTAIEAVLIKKIILYSSPTTAFICWCWFGAFFSGLLLFFFRQNIALVNGPLKGGIILKYALLVTCIGIMQFTTNYAFDHMQVGYALSLFQLSTIISVLLGHRLFGEKHIRQKLIGSAIMIIGSVIIILLKNK
ncbi:EamA family transporter [Flavihumibacter fluvii]|uniref:EamA family transporter n=1 Tax=Flavihumibacter fluvii TaxID=2838157 RepID=UPI001EFA3AB5|nr:EamA family transporter [Flavihumibacter fluvii]ULQ53742.1 EamA family transporter [Flavihumibacter fluvii]